MFKLNIVSLALTLYVSLCSFDMDLQESNGGLELVLAVGEKRAAVLLSLSDSQLTICCKPTRTVFQTIYYFLNNPFLHAYDYSCKDPPARLQTTTFTFPKIGLLDLAYTQIQSPECNEGVIGVNKKSYFIRMLPTQNHFFTIKLNYGKNKKRQGKITLGKSQNISDGIRTKIISQHKQLWQIKFRKLMFADIESASSIITLQSQTKQIKIPNGIYKKIQNYLEESKQCRLINQYLICPCETGAPEDYPSFNFQLSNNFTIEIKPSEYMQVTAETCKLLVSPSSTPQWSISLLLFDNMEFQFQIQSGTITILKPKELNSQNQIIKLPVQMILNCFVILILCVFVALVLIQIIKRISGLSETRRQVFREHLIRRQL